MKGFYGGIDLHAKNAVACVIDEKGTAVKEKKLENDLARILEFFEPFGKEIQIAIESTVNWYWLVDGLMDACYGVQLAHPLGLKQITDAKVKTDRRDAYKLANLLRLNALPAAYIYPKDIRPLRDLLRRRSDLVAQRKKCYEGHLGGHSSNTSFAGQRREDSQAFEANEERPPFPPQLERFVSLWFTYLIVF
jgi:transposase